MFLMIDHYDSFVYNLAIYFKEIGKDVLIINQEEALIENIEKIRKENYIEGIIISPGPKGPWDCDLSVKVIRYYEGIVPILGVCLGHQIISYAYGATVEKGISPMHGKITEIKTDKEGVFKDLPERYNVTRYHSLVVKEKNLPSELKIDAVTDDNVVMAISHREKPVYGVQFHPEAVLTEYGHELLENFCHICDEFNKNNSIMEEKYA